ncbi:hypothetical protein B6I21_08925 [candidate division KSB1 bacterium 4572_119]|nr:MAG: hypothetical protein B6I21_08925 [candidate division KSB1 bacterium 4572_119]
MLPIQFFSQLFYKRMKHPSDRPDFSEWILSAGQINYAFQTLNLNRIQLHVNAKNTAAIRIYKKIGFQQEGILRQAMYKNEEYFDFLVMGILRSDWESLK